MGPHRETRFDIMDFVRPYSSFMFLRKSLVRLHQDKHFEWHGNMRLFQDLVHMSDQINY